MLNNQETAATFKGVKQPNFNANGKMREGQCRKMTTTTLINPDKRYHYASARLAGKTTSAFGGAECSAFSAYVSRLEYKDDCKVTVSMSHEVILSFICSKLIKLFLVQAKVQCLIENGAGQLTGEECSGTIKRLSATDCNDIPVRYEWKICNGENETVFINRNKSPMKVDGEVQFKVNQRLFKNSCITKRKKAIINTCDAKKTTKLCKDLFALIWNLSIFDYLVTNPNPAFSFQLFP